VSEAGKRDPVQQCPTGHKGPRSLPTFPANAALLNYFGNSKSNAFNDILAFDLLRTIAPRGSG